MEEETEQGFDVQTLSKTDLELLVSALRETIVSISVKNGNET